MRARPLSSAGRGLGREVLSVSGSQRVHEGDEARAVSLGQRGELVARGFRLAAMPQDRFVEVARAAVMQEQGVAVDDAGQPDAPQRRGAPLFAAGLALGSI